MINGMTCFQRIINIIDKEKLKCTFAYVNNTTIYSDYKNEHDRNLKLFVEAASKYGISGK